MNKVVIAGNLTKDPEFKQTASGVPMCTMVVAVNRPHNAGGDKDVDFFDVIAWRGQAESSYKHLKKGSKVCVSGYIQKRTVEGADGNKRFYVEIVADDVEFLTAQRSEQL